MELVYNWGQETLEMIKAEQALPVEVQRLKYFTQKVTDHGYGSGSHRHFLVEKAWWSEDNKFYFTRDKYTIFLSSTGKLFTRHTNQHGLTFNPAETVGKGTHLWRGTSMSQIPRRVIEALLISQQAEWAVEFHGFMTKSLLARVLKGRLTNGEDFMRSYLKTSTMWKPMKISHRASSMVKLFRISKQSINFENTLSEYHDLLSHVSNIEATIDMLLNGKKVNDFAWYQTPFTEDMRRELNILGRKIDSTWSENRLSQVHTQMSRDIRELEMSTMKDIDYAYSSPAPLMPGMELISNNKRLFVEGSEMSHCVYSYLNSAIDRSVFHFHCKFGESPFTLAIQASWNSGKWYVQQMFGKYNRSCSPTQKSIVEKWIEEDVVQAWFTMESKIKAHNVVKPQLDVLPDLPF
jgi:hypothetical protein